MRAAAGGGERIAIFPRLLEHVDVHETAAEMARFGAIGNIEIDLATCYGAASVGARGPSAGRVDCTWTSGLDDAYG